MFQTRCVGQKQIGNKVILLMLDNKEISIEVYAARSGNIGGKPVEGVATFDSWSEAVACFEAICESQRPMALIKRWNGGTVLPSAGEPRKPRKLDVKKPLGKSSGIASMTDIAEAIRNFANDKRGE